MLLARGTGSEIKFLSYLFISIQRGIATQCAHCQVLRILLDSLLRDPTARVAPALWFDRLTGLLTWKVGPWAVLLISDFPANVSLFHKSSSAMAILRIILYSVSNSPSCPSNSYVM